MRRLWRWLRWTTCAMCGAEFKKGQGGGVSRSVLCSEECNAEAWREWMRL